MLPLDAKQRKKVLTDKGQLERQSSVTEHFAPEDPASKPIPYSDKALETASLEWLIETNQVSLIRYSRCISLLSQRRPNICHMAHISQFKPSDIPRSRRCLTSHPVQTEPSNCCHPSSRGRASSRCSNRRCGCCGIVSR